MEKDEKKPIVPAISVRAPEQFGHLIRRWRKAKKMTQSELAQKAGVAQKTISSIESGKKHTAIGTILTLCNVLNLQVVVRERPAKLDDSSKFLLTNAIDKKKK